MLGGGRSGRAAARLAHSLGADVTLSDQNPDCAPLEGVTNVMGEHPDSILDTDTLVVSPGIPAMAPPVQQALFLGTEVVGELGFAAEFLPDDVPIVAITGTNGKSTVTSFTGQLLRAGGLNVFEGGNLGTPLSDAVGKPWDALVVEVSSYQMELPGSFEPDVAAVLNLSPDHLQRHKTMESYAAHKLRLLSLLRESGVGVLPRQDALIDRLAENLECEVLRFDSPEGLSIEGHRASICGHPLDLSSLDIPGALNRWNAGAACLLAHLAGLPVEALRPGVLKALPHRMQDLPSTNGLRWINDSKATNVEATLAGVMGLSAPVFLLLGGQGKGGADYAQLRRLFSEGPVREAVVFGQAGSEIAQALQGLNVRRVETLSQAVELARELAEQGSDVVLSPACASFDEFDDFTHRGRVFEALATGVGDAMLEEGRGQ